MGAIPALRANRELVEEHVSLAVKETSPPDGHLQFLLVINIGRPYGALKDHTFKGRGNVHGESVCESGCQPGMVGDLHREEVVGVMSHLQSSKVRGGRAKLEGRSVAAGQAVTDTCWR